jgi:hypothetical protein
MYLTNDFSNEEWKQGFGFHASFQMKFEPPGIPKIASSKQTILPAFSFLKSESLYIP